MPARTTRVIARRGALALLVATGAGCSADPEESKPVNVDGGAQASTELVAVVRQDVAESHKLEANVGYGPVITVPIEAEGIITDAPAPLAILGSGDTLVEVAGRPVVLVLGESPLYRPLRLVARGERDEAGTRIASLTGDDVAQLQRYLLDEGFDDKGRLTADEVFGLSTQRAVKAWQKSIGHPQTGVVDASQMVFMPRKVLVQSQLVIGQPFEGLDVSGSTTVLQASASTTSSRFFPVGSTVEIVTGNEASDDGTGLTGTVTRSSRITSPDSGPTQLIEVAVEDLAPDELGQSVQIIGTLTRAPDALTVPVRALLALSDGGWELEVDRAGTTERVPVELISVVGTTAIVAGVDEGESVVVPR